MVTPITQTEPTSFVSTPWAASTTRTVSTGVVPASSNAVGVTVIVTVCTSGALTPSVAV